MDDVVAIRVALIGMDKRKAGLLGVYIHMMSRQRCAVCDPGDADIAVIDFDTPDALDALSSIRRARPDIAVLGLSYDSAVPSGLMRLEKPVRGPELLDALYSLSPANEVSVPPIKPSTPTGAAEATREAAPQVQPKSAPKAEPKADPRAAPEPTVHGVVATAAVHPAARPGLAPIRARPSLTRIRLTEHIASMPVAPEPTVTRQARVVDTGSAQAALDERHGDKFHIRGVLVSANPNDTFEVDCETITFVRNLLAQVRQSGESREVAFGTLPGAALRFHPTHAGLVTTSMSDGTLRSLCVSSNALMCGDVSIHTCPAYDPDHTLARVITGHEFLWKLALWCGRGRRPRAIADTTRVSLQRWPNLTRVLAIDHATRICALLVAGPHSMAEAARILQVDIRLIHAICGAAKAIDLLNIHADLAEVPLAVPAQGPAPELAGAGLFGRIIRHIFR